MSILTFYIAKNNLKPWKHAVTIGTLKTLHCSMSMSAGYRLKFEAPHR